MFNIRLKVVLCIGFFSCKNESTLELKNQGSLFTLADAKQTGVEFTNELTEGLNTNILMYEYFYNGGGVGAGDLNGDARK
jgi:hypothetical protein